MGNDLPTSTYIKIAVTIFLLPVILIIILVYGDDIMIAVSNTFEEITLNSSIKNMEITQQNYQEIYDIVYSSTDITLQEKANFKKNYLLFGKSLIGYKVKDVLKEIKW